MSSKLDIAPLLRAAGLRATPGRVRILEVLASLKEPVRITMLQKLLKKDTLDEVTLYRALDALVRARLVTRSDLQHGHAHYELAVGRTHHHHVVCTTCGTVEDIEVTHDPEPEREALRRTKGFSSIDAYALEFFGVCVKCA